MGGAVPETDAALVGKDVEFIGYETVVHARATRVGEGEGAALLREKGAGAIGDFSDVAPDGRRSAVLIRRANKNLSIVRRDLRLGFRRVQALKGELVGDRFVGEPRENAPRRREWISLREPFRLLARHLHVCVCHEMSSNQEPLMANR